MNPTQNSKPHGEVTSAEDITESLPFLYTEWLVLEIKSVPKKVSKPRADITGELHRKTQVLPEDENFKHFPNKSTRRSKSGKGKNNGKTIGNRCDSRRRRKNLPKSSPNNYSKKGSKFLDGCTKYEPKVRK